MLAKDVMTTKVVSVLEDTPVEELVRTLLDWRISGVPVLDDGGAVVGIVSEGDLVRRADPDAQGDQSWWLAGLLDTDQRAARFAKAHGRLAKDVMTTEVVSVDERDPVSAIATLLEEKRIKRVPVLRDGRLVGIVSRANLLHGMAAAPALTGDGSRSADASAGRGIGHEDSEIRASILNRLHNEIGLDATINVIVRQGIVDLWGGVVTEAQRQAIRSVAENAEGVSRVVDHLSVLSPALRHMLGGDASD